MIKKKDRPSKDDNNDNKHIKPTESTLQIKVQPKSVEITRQSTISNADDDINKKRRSTALRQSNARRPSNFLFLGNSSNVKDFITNLKVTRDEELSYLTSTNMYDNDKDLFARQSRAYSFFMSDKMEIDIDRNTFFCLETREPDHGYAFFVLTMVVILTMLGNGGILSFAFMKVSLIDLTGYKSEVIAWIGSLFYLFTSMTGIFLGPIVQKYGVRLIIICGSIIVTLACILMFLITNLYVYYFAWGLTFGVGFSALNISGPLAISHWFTKRKSFAIGLAMSGLSFSMLFWGKMIFFLEEKYGFRGTLLLIGGIELNACVLAMLIIPGPNAVKPSLIKTKEKKRRLPCNFTLFRQVPFVLFFFSYFLLMYAHIIPVLFMREKCRIINLRDEDSGHLISIMGITSGVLRPIFGVFADRPWFNKRLIFAISMCLGGISSIVGCFLDTYIGLFVFLTFYGIASGGYMSLAIAVLTEIVRLDQLPDGIGLALTAQGLSNFIGIPLTSLLASLFGDPSYCFIISGSCQIIGCCLILLTLLNKINN